MFVRLTPTFSFAVGGGIQENKYYEEMIFVQMRMREFQLNENMVGFNGNPLFSRLVMIVEISRD